MLNILDTLACVELACENPADRGEFRVFNQFTESFSVAADGRAWWSREYAGQVDHRAPADPRVEKEEHYYRAAHTKLLDLGLVPHLLTASVVRSLLAVCEQYKSRVDPAAILPTVEWRSTSSNLPTAGVARRPARTGSGRARAPPRSADAPPPDRDRRPAARGRH